MCHGMPQNVDYEKCCWKCKHRKSRENIKDNIITSWDILYCVAFPDEIPFEVYDNGHFTPRPDLGQTNDVVFESKGEHTEDA
ncbi:MAG: hypothetical protein FWG98_15615 [Candidatus Cloacimonetes bacterium]|nr:hypothetical protein [Candidatus Cloacimonadota bacterium]